MTRMVSVTLGAVLAVGVGLATAQQKAVAKTMSMKGTVKAVSASSLTVESDKTKESISFTLDPITRVLSRDVTSRGKEKRATGAAVSILDLVRAGDLVTVKYYAMGDGTMLAAELQVRASATGKK